MTSLETYRSNAAEAPIMRRWLFAALVLSLLIHGGLILYAYRKRLEGFKQPVAERLAPPLAFNLKQVTIPKMDDAGEKITKLQDKPTATVQNIPIPAEKPEVAEIQYAPQNTADLTKQLAPDKPKVDPAGLDRLANVEAGARNAIDKELTALNTALLKESPRSSPRQPLISTSPGSNVGAGSGESNAAIPGMRSLDDALAQTGPLHAGDKAGMPGGALFEYDSYELRSEAVEQLKKLGLLIERNPRATFSIEGHTDSFGSADYNLRLSEQRAESVKEWLVRQMGISPERIQTRGFGNSRPLVSSDKDKDQQAPNRRVEIVVKTNRK